MWKNDIWRNLFVKCFSLLIILLISLSLYAQDEIVIQESIHLSPYKQAILKNGDKTIIKLNSKLANDELKKYVSKKIADKFYVLKFFESEEGKFYEVFVLNPVQQNPKSKDKTISLAEDFKFEFDKDRIAKEFMILDVPYEEIIKTPLWQYILYSLVGFIFMFVTFRYAYIPLSKKNKIRRKRKKKAESIIRQLDTVKTREDFERIYQIKDDLHEFLDIDGHALKQFYQKLNAIQYKQNWTEEEKNSLEKIYKKIGDVKFKHGI